MALRQIGEDDLELMLRWRNHPSVRSSMFSQSIIELEQHRLWFERESKKSDSVWLLFIDESNTPRGVVYFTEMNRVSRNAFWGFYDARANAILDQIQSAMGQSINREQGMFTAKATIDEYEDEPEDWEET